MQTTELPPSRTSMRATGEVLRARLLHGLTVFGEGAPDCWDGRGDLARTTRSRRAVAGSDAVGAVIGVLS
jgi:hypothetical protein